MSPTKHISGQKWLRVISLRCLRETGHSIVHHRILATLGMPEAEQALWKARDLSLKNDGLCEFTYKDFPVWAACVFILPCVHFAVMIVVCGW